MTIKKGWSRVSIKGLQATVDLEMAAKGLCFELIRSGAAKRPDEAWDILDKGLDAMSNKYNKKRNRTAG